MCSIFATCAVYLRRTQSSYDEHRIFTTYTEYLPRVQYTYHVHRIVTMSTEYLRRTQNIYDVLCSIFTTYTEYLRGTHNNELGKVPTCLHAIVHTALAAERVFTELLQVCVCVFVSRCLPGSEMKEPQCIILYRFRSVSDPRVSVSASLADNGGQWSSGPLRNCTQ